jgi:DNA-binding response OmpR family regulator
MPRQGERFSAVHQSKTRPHIIIVDDDQVILEMYRCFFEDAYPEVLVTICTSTEEAMQQAENCKCQLAITDLLRPEPDSGYAFIEAAKRRFPTIPVWVVSARHISEAEEIALGIDGSIRKPFELIVLGERINAFLKRGGDTRDDWG